MANNFFEALGVAAGFYGKVTWGGNFSGFIDKPHVEYEYNDSPTTS